MDLPNGTILVGQHEVPVIPEADLCWYLKHKPDVQALILIQNLDVLEAGDQFNDGIAIPSSLEQALMTCPIRLPTEDEL